MYRYFFNNMNRSNKPKALQHHLYKGQNFHCNNFAMIVKAVSDKGQSEILTKDDSNLLNFADYTNLAQIFLRIAPIVFAMVYIMNSNTNL